MKINVDLGEIFPNKPDKHEESLMPFIDWANIACGGHSGNEKLMAYCLDLAKSYGVQVGAHPSYPDPKNFGRIPMAISQEELAKSLRDQIEKLVNIGEALQQPVTYLKFHGALYHQCIQDKVIWNIAAELLKKFQLQFLLVPANFKIPKDWQKLPTKKEVFADRGTNKDGSLIPRGEKGALIEKAEDSLLLYSKFSKENHDTICLHGDEPGVLNKLRYIQNSLVKLYSLSPDYFEIEYSEHSRLNPNLLEQQLLKIPTISHTHSAFFSILISCQRDKALKSTIQTAIGKSFGDNNKRFTARKFSIPVYYGKSVALDRDKFPSNLIELHANKPYQIQAIGFSPGFAYLSKVSTELQIPRMPAPRKKIPAGSVAIANQFTAIYPQESPGGWNIIGNCPICLFNRPMELIYRKGDIFQFHSISKREWEKLKGGNIVLAEDHLL